jgi:agmatinase
MMKPMFLQPPDRPFLDADIELDPALVVTPYAFLGIPFGPPYEFADLVVSAGAATAVREAAHRMEYGASHLSHDFDWDGALFPDGRPTVTDCGDVIGDVRDPDSIWDRALDVVRPLAAAGRVPLVIGGLDAIPPIVVGAFEGVEAVNVLHVDAHIDFSHERHGVIRGYSSPIRRIREMPWVGEIVQVGLRSVGWSRPEDVAQARRGGNRLVTAWEVHERGARAILDELDAEGRWVVTVDCDGLDPSVAPGVGWPEPGGLTYPQLRTLVAGLSSANRVAAVVFTELQPDRDIHQATATVVARLLMNVIAIQRHPDPGSRAAGPRSPR